MPDPAGHGVVALKFGGAAFMIPKDWRAALSAAVQRGEVIRGAGDR